ncbi:hypothetical protein LTR95_003519 [Oleoguttula sp. CCFEE 5521]
MAHNHGQQSGYQRDNERGLRRAQAEVADLAGLGSRFDTASSGRPAYGPAPSHFAGYPGHSEPPSEQTLEQIIRSYDYAHMSAPSGSSRGHMHRSQTIDPRQLILHRQEDPFMPASDAEGFTVVQPRRSRRQNSPPVSHSPNGRVLPPPRMFVPTISVTDNEAIIRDQPPPFAPGVSNGRQRNLVRNVQTATAILQGVPIAPIVPCPVCSKPFKNAAGLRHHEMVHDPIRMQQYQCRICGRGFPYPKSLERHTNARHRTVGDIARTEFPCPSCGRIFDRLDNLQRHQRGQSRTASTASSVRSPTPSARGGRRPSVRCRPPVFTSSPGTPSSGPQGHPSYAEVAQRGHRRALMSSPLSRSSSQSTYFSSPSSPFPQFSTSTAGTEYDWSQVDPRLRKISSPSERSYTSRLR